MVGLSIQYSLVLHKHYLVETMLKCYLTVLVPMIVQILMNYLFNLSVIGKTIMVSIKQTREMDQKLSNVLIF